MSNKRPSKKRPTPSPEHAANEREQDEVLAIREDGELTRPNRRTFLKASAVGAGLLALPGVRPGSAEAAGSADAEADSAAAAGSSGSGAASDCDQENWVEPWEWRVEDHPGQALQLNVVEHHQPATVFADEPAEETPGFLFSYNGLIPGPTIRMNGNDVLAVNLNNMLSGNDGTWAATNGTRFVMDGMVPLEPNTPPVKVKANEPVPKGTPDWLLALDHVYGPHQQHTTNLHTHGLHVSPHHNDDLTHSDNVLLRIIPRQDYKHRMENDPPLPLRRPWETMGETRYQFKLGKSSGPRVETHPPGTHWYHPHPHGATYDQVASGMAGFLIVEGDVDDYLVRQIRGYRERLMLVQRVVGPAPKPSEGSTMAGQQTKAQFTANTVNGRPAGSLSFKMRPGAIERWRVLNGSVDGQGYVDFMVVKGDPGQSPRFKTQAKVGSLAYYKDLQGFYKKLRAFQDKLQAMNAGLDHLAFDGITLVTPDGKYTTRPTDSVTLAPANRSDFLFEAPPLAKGETCATYTIWAKWVSNATDRPTPPTPADIKVATIHVSGEPFDSGVTRGPDGRLQLDLPPVPKYLTPIQEDEIAIQEGPDRGKWRTRIMRYAGWGNASYPATQACRDAQKKMFPRAGKIDLNSMTINGLKFDGADPVQRMGLGTAEQWTLDNYSMTIYCKGPNNTDCVYGKSIKQEEAVDMIVASGNAEVSLPAKAADHPFHIHQNPFWVMSILDENGNELLPDGKPRWQDVVRIPRNGGRVVFRSRFWNYTGEYVHHCHLLQHEDWGMMETVEVVDPYSEMKPPNFDVNAPGYAYPELSVREMYDRNLKIRTSMPDSEYQFCSDDELDPGPPDE